MSGHLAVKAFAVKANSIAKGVKTA